MKVLLCGEYSGVFSNLSTGLKKNNIDVTTLSEGDGYKKIQADVVIENSSQLSGLFFRVLYPILEFCGLRGLRTYIKNRGKITCSSYDVVQIINPVIIQQFGVLGNLLFFFDLKKRSKIIVLSALGDDRAWVWCCLRKMYSPNALTRLSFSNLRDYYGSLRYIFHPLYLFLSLVVERFSDGIVCGLEDYKLAYSGSDKSRFIHLPISIGITKAIPTPDVGGRKFVLFHAWQKGKENKKGNDVIDRAITRLISLRNDIEYVVASGLPYDEFKKALARADFFFDQVYSLDYGMSGLLGLMNGKLVFSGFSRQEPVNHLLDNRIKTIGIDSPKTEDEYVELINLLLNSIELCGDIRNNALLYVKENHDSAKVAREYIDFWTELFNKYDK